MLRDQLGRLRITAHQVLEFAPITRPQLERVAREYLDSYRYHIEMEEDLFFPAVAETMTREDWIEVETESGAPHYDPLFSEKFEERFVALRQDIAA